MSGLRQSLTYASRSADQPQDGTHCKAVDFDPSRKAAVEYAPHTALDIEGGWHAQHTHKSPHFPWKLSIIDHMRVFVLSAEFRAAVQLSVGQLVVCLFVLVNSLTFTNVCLCSIFHVAAVVLAAQDPHVGSKLTAAAAIIGPLWFGSIIAGCVVSVARACQVAYTGMLCLFIAIGAFPVCLLRATLGPGIGIICNLGFGVVIIAGQFAWAPTQGYKLIWKDAVWHLLLDALIAALGATAGGLVALPTLASHSLRMEAADVLMKIGHSLSGYATHMFEKAEVLQTGYADHGAQDGADRDLSQSTSPQKLAGHTMAKTALLDDQSDEDYWDVMQEATNPAGVHMPRHMTCAQTTAVASLRPMVAHCRALLEEAAKEPPFIGRHRLLLAKWQPLLNALETLITKAAALESLLEGRGESLLHDGRLRELVGKDVVPVMRVVYAHMAAACASLATLLTAHRGQQKGMYPSIFGTSWKALEHELSHTLHSSIQCYWTRWSAGHDTKCHLPQPQVRALLYASTLTGAIMEAVANMEAAVMDALAHQATCYPRPSKATFDLGAQASQPVHEALSVPGDSGKPKLSEGETGANSRPGMHAWLWNEVAWTVPLLRIVLAQMCFLNLWVTLTHTIPQTCCSKALLIDTILHGRKFQFFCKYYVVMCGALCGSVILSKDIPAIREWSPIYLVITVIVVMSEKVDTTITKGVLRLIGTGLGGVLGYLVMMRTSLATTPVALAAIVCAYTWLLGLASNTQFKYAVFLTLVTANAVILCQYSPRPGSHGRPHYFYARCTTIAVSIVLVWLIGLILPWFTYTDALDKLGGAYKQATQLTLQFYITFRDDVKFSDEQSKDAKQRAASMVGLLEKKVAAPLVGVQTALARETVLWTKGVLVMPKVVGETLRAMQVLLDRLSALQMMLVQKPVLSGRYTSAPYHHMLQPLDLFVMAVMDSAVKLGALTAELLSEKCTQASLDAVHTEIKQMEVLRAELRRNYIRVFHKFCLEVKSESTSSQAVHKTADDSVRYLSFLFAASNVLDKATLLAKAVCADGWVQIRCHSRWRANMQTWLGL